MVVRATSRTAPNAKPPGRHPRDSIPPVPVDRHASAEQPRSKQHGQENGPVVGNEIAKGKCNGQPRHKGERLTGKPFGEAAHGSAHRSHHSRLLTRSRRSSRPTVSSGSLGAARLNNRPQRTSGADQPGPPAGSLVPNDPVVADQAGGALNGRARIVQSRTRGSAGVGRVTRRHPTQIIAVDPCGMQGRPLISLENPP